MSARLRNAAGAAALALVVAAPLQGQSILLRMAPDEGLVSRYVIGTETYMAMMGGGEPIATTEMYQTQTILSVDGDVVEIQTAIDSSSIASAMPGAAAGMPELSGLNYTVKMDTRGRLVEFTDTGDLPPEAEQVVSQMAGGSFFQLPEGEVSPGDSWSANTSLDVPAAMGGSMVMEMDITYTLMSVDGDLANVSFEGPIAMSGDAGGMSMDGAGGLTGTAVFDVGMGRLQSQDSAMSLDVNAGGMSLSMDTNNSMALIP